VNNEAPLGVFEEQVMLCAIRTGDEAYGMNVRRELESVTGREVSIGAVYSTLDRLEAKGLVTSRRGPGSGSRRTFAVMRPGLAMLAETRAIRERLWRGIDLTRLPALA
jgi:PadR family transcriptional regulator PadR